MLLVPEYEDCLKAYVFYEQGILPRGTDAGWIEQPAYWINIIEIVRGQVALVRNELTKQTRDDAGDRQ